MTATIMIEDRSRRQAGAPVQRPTVWKLNLGRLDHFLQVLPRGCRHVVEFREPGLAPMGRLPGRAPDAGADVYAYFNNDPGGHAPRDAVTLRRFLEAQT
jgi:hypothetical protein